MLGNCLKWTFFCGPGIRLSQWRQTIPHLGAALAAILWNPRRSQEFLAQQIFDVESQTWWGDPVRIGYQF
jgi:hypothetical protein